jgi:hypothetical protein
MNKIILSFLKHLVNPVYVYLCSLRFAGFGGGPKSPYAINPERDESSFCAIRPAHMSSVVSFAVLIVISFSLPRVVIVISPCKSVR